MITPRVTRLLRASDLRTFQSAIAGVVPRGWDARRTAIVVPSRSAAEELRRTIEDLTLAADGPGMTVMPDLVTRHELYARMQEHLADAPRLLTDFDRARSGAAAAPSWYALAARLADGSLLDQVASIGGAAGISALQAEVAQLRDAVKAMQAQLANR